MKFKKSTWILVSIALLMGGFVYFYETYSKPQQEAIQAKKQQIFDFQEEDIQALTIKKGKETLQFERINNANSSWRMKQPEDTLANDATVSFLISLLVEGKSDRNFTVSSNQVKDYSFDQPFATINIQLKNQSSHQLILGKSDFQDQSIYAQIDPPSQLPKEITVYLVDKSFQYALERDIAEWKQPTNK